MNNPDVNWSKLDPALVSTASPRHIQSVLEDAKETIALLEVEVFYFRLLNQSLRIDWSVLCGDELDIAARRYGLFRGKLPLESDDTFRTRLISHLESQQ